MQSQFSGQLFILRLMAYGLFETGVPGFAKQLISNIFSVLIPNRSLLVKIQKKTSVYELSAHISGQLCHEAVICR